MELHHCAESVKLILSRPLGRNDYLQQTLTRVLSSHNADIAITSAVLLSSIFIYKETPDALQGRTDYFTASYLLDDLRSRILDEVEIDTLLRHLGSDKAEDVIRLLGMLKSDAAVDPLIEMYHTGCHDNLIIEALSRIGGKRTIAFLVDLLSKSPESVNKEVVSRYLRTYQETDICSGCYRVVAGPSAFRKPRVRPEPERPFSYCGLCFRCFHNDCASGGFSGAWGHALICKDCVH
jgi:hypothetical protein